MDPVLPARQGPGGSRPGAGTSCACALGRSGGGNVNAIAKATGRAQSGLTVPGLAPTGGVGVGESPRTRKVD